MFAGFTSRCTNGVKGESQAQGMSDNIELDSWSFGASSPADIGGKGLAAGKPSLSDFTCSWALDSASYQVLKNLVQGTHIDQVTFTGRKIGGGGTPYNYVQVNLSNCLVTGFHTGGGSNGVPSANLSLAYEKIEYQYYTQDSSSGSTSLAGSATYSIPGVQAS